MSSSDAQLDPALFGLSAESIRNLPLGLLLAHHPGLSSATQAPISQFQQESSAGMSPPSPPPQAPIHAPTPATSTPEGNETGIDVDDTVPSRPLSSFAQPDRMQWTFEDALRMKEPFSRVDCTRNPDGTCIKKAEIAKISKAIAFACAALFDMDIHDYLEGRVRNFRFFKENYLQRLVDISKGLERKFPILSWCSYHYKAMKWIEFHLKAHNEQISKKKREAAASNSKSTTSASNAGSSTSNKTQKKKRAAEPEPSASKKKLKKRHSLDESGDEEEEDIFSQDDDVDSTIHSSKSTAKPKSKTKFVAPPNPATGAPVATVIAKATPATAPVARQKLLIPDLDPTKALSALPQHRASLSAAPRPENGTSQQTTSGASTAGILLSLSSASFNHDYSKDGDVATPNDVQSSQIEIPDIPFATSSSIGKEIQIPVRTTHIESSTATRTVLKLPARARPALRSMDKDPSVVSNLNAEVANMASTSASTLLPATIADIRAALSTRFSSLSEIDLVHSALSVFETAQACGIDPAAAGDPEFLSWLQGLEALVPENDTDEDEVGQQFGHRTIGTWSYHQPLSNKPRATASGKLSESRIRRLGQKRATTILELASIPIKDKKQAVDMLAAAWLSGTVVLSDQQVRQAEQNLPIEGTVKATEPDDD